MCISIENHTFAAWKTSVVKFELFIQEGFMLVSLSKCEDQSLYTLKRQTKQGVY